MINLARRTLLAAVTAAAFASSAFFAHAVQAEQVRVSVAYYSEATKPYFEEMAKQFMAANPGSEIKIEVSNWDGLLQKLQTDVAGNANADVAIIGTRWILDFIKDDVIEDLDGRMDAAFKDRFIGTFLSPSVVGGKTYGLPIAASARALYYNKDLLTKAGFPDGPKTWDDVVAASKKIKEGGNFGFGLQGKEIETDVYFFYSLWTHGGDILNKDGKAAFDSEAGVKALTLYKDMIDQGLTQEGVTGYSREDVQNLFKQGRLGMAISAPFLAKQLKTDAPNLKYGVTSIPTAGASATYSATDSLIMFKNSKSKDTAWKFMDYLFTKAPRVAFSSKEGFLPTTKAEAEAPEFSDPETKVFVDLLPNAHFTPTVTGWEDTAKALTNALQAVYTGKTKPDAALKQAAEEANKVLGK